MPRTRTRGWEHQQNELLGVVLVAGATMLLPFTLDRGEHDASVYAFAAPLPDELAA
jgi:hypothetical protein